MEARVKVVPTLTTMEVDSHKTNVGVVAITVVVVAIIIAVAVAISSITRVQTLGAMAVVVVATAIPKELVDTRLLEVLTQLSTTAVPAFIKSVEEDAVVAWVHQAVEVKWEVFMALKIMTFRVSKDKAVGVVEEAVVEATKAITLEAVALKVAKVVTNLKEAPKASRTIRLSCVSTLRQAKPVLTLTIAPMPMECMNCVSK